MDAEKKRLQRERRRREGYKPVELWLPTNLIDKIDSMKNDEIASRDAVIMAVLQDTLNIARPVKSKDQLMLL
jgi:metal-responsive CopG/Arc/MetJ family transcriptional regulator